MAGVEGVKVTLLRASLGPRREQIGRADWAQIEEKDPKPMVNDDARRRSCGDLSSVLLGCYCEILGLDMKHCDPS